MLIAISFQMQPDPQNMLELDCRITCTTLTVQHPENSMSCLVHGGLAHLCVQPASYCIQFPNLQQQTPVIKAVAKHKEVW